MHDQTREEWLQGITLNTQGTGVYVMKPSDVPNIGKYDFLTNIVSSTFGPLAKVFIRSINVAEHSDLVGNRVVIAGKWVPDTTANFPTLTQASCTTTCVTRCADYGCVCVAGECK